MKVFVVNTADASGYALSILKDLEFILGIVVKIFSKK